MDGNNNGGRPAVLDNVSETQIEELERQYAEHDHQGWDALTGSYGWDEATGKQVWDWFGSRPQEGSGQ